MKLYEFLEKSIVNKCGERIVEYTFVYQSICSLLTLSYSCRRNIKILDIGCCESNLAKTLAELGFDVIGIDINYCDICPARLLQANILETEFEPNSFDIILAISTVEHIGLSCYGQKVQDNNGDIITMQKIYRWLKPNGIAIITVPYGKPHHPPWFERVYNKDTLFEHIVQNFEIVRLEVWCRPDLESDNWYPCSLDCVDKDCVALLLLRK